MKKRIKAKRMYSLERAPYPDDIEYYRTPKEYLKPRKHGPFIDNTTKPNWNDAVRIVVNKQLSIKGIPYRLPRSFDLSSIYEGKRFTLGAAARQLILKHIDRKTPQYVKSLQSKAHNILLLKNHPENDVVHVKPRSQRWNPNHRTKPTHYACMADVQHANDNDTPVDQPPTTSDPVVILETIPVRDPPTPRLDNVTGANNITNITGTSTAHRDQSLEDAIRPNKDEEDTSSIVRVGKIALNTFQAIKSHSPFSGKPKQTVELSKSSTPPFADVDISLLTKESSVHGATQALANELDNITAIPESNSDESNNNTEDIDLEQIQRRLEYLTGGDLKDTPTADEVSKLKSDVEILCQTRQTMEDNLTETRSRCNKLQTENESALTRDVAHARDLFHRTKEFAEKQQSLHNAKMEDKDSIIDKMQRQIDASAQVNSSLRSKYHDVTTEHLETKQEIIHLTQIISEMSDRNDSLQRQLEDCLEGNVDDSDDKPCKGNCRETKIICKCECTCRCSKKKRKRRGDNDDHDDDHDDDNASDESDDDDNSDQLAYDADGQYVPERKLTTKQQKTQSKDTA
jgi:hypothetical protein